MTLVIDILIFVKLTRISLITFSIFSKYAVKITASLVPTKVGNGIILTEHAISKDDELRVIEIKDKEQEIKEEDIEAIKEIKEEEIREGSIKTIEEVTTEESGF
jgi:hypothetical protein